MLKNYRKVKNLLETIWYITYIFFHNSQFKNINIISSSLLANKYRKIKSSYEINIIYYKRRKILPFFEWMHNLYKKITIVFNLDFSSSIKRNFRY